MKRKPQIMFTASAASVLAFSALGQETTKGNTDGWEYLHQQMARARADRLNGAAKASQPPR